METKVKKSADCGGPNRLILQEVNSALNLNFVKDALISAFKPGLVLGMKFCYYELHNTVNYKEKEYGDEFLEKYIPKQIPALYRQLGLLGEDQHVTRCEAWKHFVDLAQRCDSIYRHFPHRLEDQLSCLALNHVEELQDLIKEKIKGA